MQQPTATNRWAALRASWLRLALVISVGAACEPGTVSLLPECDDQAPCPNGQICQEGECVSSCGAGGDCDAVGDSDPSPGDTASRICDNTLATDNCSTDETSTSTEHYCSTDADGQSISCTVVYGCAVDCDWDDAAAPDLCTTAAECPLGCADVDGLCATPVCLDAVSLTFVGSPLVEQSGLFETVWEVTVPAANIDAAVALTGNAGSGLDWPDLATLVRFNNTGTVDARDGGDYAATNSIPYDAGSPYRIRQVTDVPNARYSVYLTPPGGAEQLVAQDFAFRSEQSGTTSLRQWGVHSSSGTPNVCLVSLTPSIEVSVVGVEASSDDGNVARNTLDDDLDTRWSAVGDGETIAFELSRMAPVAWVEVAFFRGDERRSSFDVQVSADKVAWTTAQNSLESGGASNDFERFDFTQQQARYVRFVGHGNDMVDAELWNSYTEVRIQDYPIRLPDPVCTAHATTGCFGGDVYWFDSCGDREELQEDCLAPQVCSGGACVDNPVDDLVILLDVDFEDHSGGTYTSADVADDWGPVDWLNGVTAGSEMTSVETDGANQLLRLSFGLADDRNVEWPARIAGNHEELYFSQNVRVKEGFDPVYGGKLNGIAGRGWDGSDYLIIPGGCIATQSDDEIGFSARYMWHWAMPDEGCPVPVKHYLYYPARSEACGDSFGLPWANYLEPVWHNITLRVVLNDIGSTNGIVETFWDGLLVSSLPNRELRRNAETKIDRLYINVFFGGAGPEFLPTRAEYIEFDDFLLFYFQPGVAGVPYGNTVSDSGRTLALPAWPKDGATGPEQVCMVGDSTADGPGELIAAMPEYNGTILAYPGDSITAQDTKWLDLSAGEKSACDYVLVQVGLNDLGSDSGTVLGRLQTLVDHINADIDPSAEIILSTLTPCRDHLIDLWGNDAYVSWQGVNEGIEGFGPTPITGADTINDDNTDDLNDGTDNLDAAYDRDGIHTNSAGDAVMVENYLYWMTD